MSYVDDLVNQSQYIRPLGYDIGLPRGAAYASYFPAWETQTPQYIQPAVYGTEQSAFRVNEFVYSIIIKRAMAEAKGRMRVNLTAGDKSEEQKDHALIKLIKHPNKNMTENMFWGIKRISQDLAGFAAFEIEYNMLGEPLRLWFMRPDWCSFRRAQQDPLAYIRYQPYGLAAMDIPLVDPQTGLTKILFFSDAEDFDPIYPGVRFYSPAMHAIGQIEVDNAATFFLRDFFKHGTKTNFLISVNQTLDENATEDLRRRWDQQHGGAENWSRPVFLGLGAKADPMQMNFKDMAFPELDARAEVRICDTFQMDPIVADARAGLDVSSYNNKREALKDWYHGWVTDTLDTDAEVMNTEMIPIYEGPESGLSCDFDLSKVYVLQEDRSARWTRAVTGYEKRVARLDEAREEAGLEPLGGDEGEAFYEVVRVTDQATLTAEGEVDESQPQGALQPGVKPKALPAPKDKAEQEAQASEEKKFRAFAKRRIKEEKREDIPHYEFKFLPANRQAELIAEVLGTTDPILVLAWSINNAVEKKA